MNFPGVVERVVNVSNGRTKAQATRACGQSPPCIQQRRDGQESVGVGGPPRSHLINSQRRCASLLAPGFVARRSQIAADMLPPHASPTAKILRGPSLSIYEMTS